MPSIFLDALIRTPFLGGMKLYLAERSIFTNFSFYTTSDIEELDELFKLRYKVYCEEYRYLDAKNYPNKRETDEFDPHSIHLVVRHKSGELVATSRLILGSDVGLPIQKHFKLEIDIPDIIQPHIGEASRLIVGTNFRRKHLLMILVKGLYLLAKKKNINDVFLVLDDRLIPNLKAIGIPIKKIGQPTIYQGVTAPYLVHINELEELMRDKNRSLLTFLSNGEMQIIGNDYKYSPH